MWDLFVPMNPTCDSWKKAFLRKVVDDRIIVFKAYRTTLETNQYSIQLLLKDIGPGMNRRGRETGHSSPSSVEIEKE
jgi:hypothetical protein